MEMHDLGTLQLDGKNISESEISCLAAKIKEVKMAEMKSPQLYAAAISQLAEEKDMLSKMKAIKKAKGPKSEVEKEVEDAKAEAKAEPEEESEVEEEDEDASKGPAITIRLKMKQAAKATKK